MVRRPLVLGSPVPLGTKIADITHADALEHSITAVAMGLPPNAVAVYVVAVRAAGTGRFFFRAASGGPDVFASNDITQGQLWVAASDGNFYYRLETANDDFDIYCMCYFVAQPEQS